MSDRYQGIYTRKPFRKEGWNYAWKGDYFITICTVQREHWFGEIEREEMRLSEIGRLVVEEWIKTPAIRPDMNLSLGAYVVMPNHFHGILSIGANPYNNPQGNPNAMPGGGDGSRGTELADPHDAATPRATSHTLPNNQFGPQSKNVASIIRGFKSAVTIQARRHTPLFGWQRRYHDHLIRDEKAYAMITTYIENNPKNWKDDRFY